MAELIITHPNGLTTQHPITARPVVIGRDATCTLCVDDPSASRQHARFAMTSDGIIVEDLGSKNGTLVNDERAPCGCCA